MALRSMVGGMTYWLGSGNLGFALGAVASVATSTIGYNMLKSPYSREGLGIILTGTAKLIKTTKDTALLKQLKADRLIVIGLLSDLEKNAERPPLKGAANQ